MGLLRDTYIINKNDPSGQYAIADQLKNVLKHIKKHFGGTDE